MEAKYGASSTPESTPEGHSSNANVFRTVTGIRWTYYDVPATEANGSSDYLLEDVALVGVARYSDTRPGTAAITSSEQPNSWNPATAVDAAFTHYHDEATSLDYYTAANVASATGTVTRTDTEATEHGIWRTKQDEQKSKNIVIYRRTPVMQFQTQTFQTEEQAKTPYANNAAQKTGYIPGEKFYYKNTLINVPKNTNPGIRQLEGELFNPVFYELIPVDYLKTDESGEIDADYLLNKLTVSWKDRTGKDVLASRTTGMHLKVEAVDTYTDFEQADFGGSMIYTSGGAGSYRAFSDLNPTAAGVSRGTTFTLFKISWEADVPGQGGSIITPEDEATRPVDDTTPGSTRMEVGDTIELYYPVRSALDGLPQVYNQLGSGTGTGSLNNTGLEPAYFPRMGEYYYYDYAYSNSAAGRINPLNGGAISLNNEASSATYVNNGSVMMDLDSLHLDAAFSGDKPEQTDTWEMFDGSLTYIPGVATNINYYYNWWDVNNWGVNGGENRDHNGNKRIVFMDEDIRTARNYQQVRYTPRPFSGTVAASMDLLPSNTRYENWWDSGSANEGPSARANDGGSAFTNRELRTYYSLVTQPRTQGDITNKTERWASETPLVWSETRLHLQKAWLATSSDFISQTEGSDLKSARKYDSGVDGRYWWRVGDYDYAAQWLRDRRGTLNDQYTTALEYNQDFTAQIGRAHV